jgi:uncharacterized protein (TIGR00266 family)
MEYDIRGGDSYPVLEVALQPGEEVVAESGAMCWMDQHVQCKTAARGGVLASMKRKLLTGESLFQNTYSVEREPGMVGLVAGAPGTIVPYDHQGDELYLEKGAYLASGPGVKIDAKFDGLKGLFNEGLFVMKTSGTGPLFFSGYGDVRMVEVDGTYKVDNGYAVAWDTSLSYKLTKAKKIRSFLFGDQLILEFRGQGRLWVQSRSAQALANFFHPYRPVQNNN